jgi:hypothetical protein
VDIIRVLDYLTDSNFCFVFVSADDWSILDASTFWIVLIIRLVGVTNVSLAVYLFRRTAIAAIAADGAVTVSLYRLRAVSINGLITPLIWTEVIRILTTKAAVYLPPLALPLCFVAEAGSAPLLFKWFVPAFIIFGMMETAAEMSYYGINTDVVRVHPPPTRAVFSLTNALSLEILEPRCMVQSNGRHTVLYHCIST